MKSWLTEQVPSSGAAAMRPSRLLLGVALSLLAHGALLFALRDMRPPRASLAEAGRLTVWLRTPPPTPAPAPRLAPPVAPPPKPKRPVEPRRAAVVVSTPVIAVEPKPAEKPAAPTAVTLPLPPPPPPPEAPTAKHFDAAAALRLARKIAHEPDPPSGNRPLDQLRKKPDYKDPEDTKLARDVANAKRPDCKDGVPGGLLAPIFLMLDKKDSGCKW